ncbi:discoidin domain-containing protein [Paenibacillus sp. CF384]|uniref:discoidin domain-containing protein n=1 Tax=Paenibacillus sp. CF384 TaxID=1884382 RepID=UPI00089C8C31|nr:discoidin domain-containing protein [Paenibacillus sp. CF384]SDW80426.1 Maltogenic Amylase, C-terminal domain [Paenibacillus sp. CF384]
MNRNTRWMSMMTVMAMMMTLFALFAPVEVNIAHAANGNLALTGTATASSAQSSTYAAGKAVDGNLTTYWNASSTSMPQWLQIDLGGLYTLSKIDQTFANDDVWKYKIEGSIDNANWATLVDKSASASGRTFGDSVNGTYRYVKLTVLSSASGYAASSQELTIIGSDEGYIISQGKAYTASSNLVKYEPSKAGDGNTSTYWAASSGSTPQWLKVDLGSPSIVTGVEQNFKDFDTFGFKIEGSLDNTSWTMLLDRMTPAAGQSFKQAVSGTYRYVRLTVNSSASGFWSGSTEFNVYGFANLALGKSTSASTTEPGWDTFKAVDGDPSTYWLATDAAMPQSLTVDLGGISSLKRVEQNFFDADIWKFKIEASLDNVNWTMLADKTGAGINGTFLGQDVSGTYRYVRLTVTFSQNSHWACSGELKVFGTPLERNLAVGTSVTSSSLAPGYEPWIAVDGNPNSYWIASDATMPQWIIVDLGVNSLVTRLEQNFFDPDIWKFKIEGSTDKTNWTMLVDKTGTGINGTSSVTNVTGTYRYIRLTVNYSQAAHWACSGELKVFGYGSPVTTKWWESTSGVMRYYAKYYNQTFNYLTSQLDTLKSKGYGAIELVAPYPGAPDVWAGLGATDNYGVDTSLGTMAEMENLISQAHAKGIRIVVMLNPGYARDTAAMFLKAADDYRNNVYSKERYWFHFSPTPSPYERWTWSARANAYYWAYWGDDPATPQWDSNIPSYNFANQEWRDEAKKYLRFWMDKGFDGIVLDAPVVYDGINVSINNSSITDVLRNYDISSNAEGAGGQEMITDWHYNLLQDYEITNWGGSGYSTIIPAINNQNPNAIDGILKNNRDAINAVNGITQTPPSWEIAGVSSTKRLLEIATLTTMGTFFYLHNGQHTIDPTTTIIPTWPASDQNMLSKLIKAQNSYKALSPNGSRVKLNTNDNNKYYAFKRTNKTGTSKALVILNYQNASQTITVNLANTDISTSQTPVDLLNGGAAAAITSTSYTVTLPAYGFTVLGVN